MKEEVLHHIWKSQSLRIFPLKTVDNQNVKIKKTGVHNHDSGPDFQNARIVVGDTEWAGHVEIHVRSSDWFSHEHQQDRAYDNVILHVVFKHDIDSKLLPIPTLELKPYLNEDVVQKYKGLLENPNYSFIPCEKDFGRVDEFKRNHFLSGVLMEKMADRERTLNAYLKRTAGDWEHACVKLLAYCFGLKINAQAFEILLNSIPPNVLKKVRRSELETKALLIGQGNLWSRLEANDSKTRLYETYEFLKNKFHLSPITQSTFKYSRLRPVSFPERRLNQLAILLFEFPSVFDLAMNIHSSKNNPLNNKELKDKIGLTEEFIDRLLINCFLPIQFTYQRSRGKDMPESVLDILQEIKPDKNKIIRQFKALGIEVMNAKKSQSLLELHKNYCKKLKCLNCVIGNEVLKP